MKIYATTAQLPGFSFLFALEKITIGLIEPYWGVLSHEHVQLCPQTSGVLTPQMCEKVRSLYPQTTLRLHANARVLNHHVLWDVSTYNTETHFYYKACVDRMLRLGASIFSVHAGYKKNCPKADEFWNNILKLRELVDHQSQGKVTLAVEGLYPSSNMPQWIETWEDYAELLHRKIPFALDMSHLQIVAQHEKKWDNILLKNLIESSLCKEIHVSQNNGKADQHKSMNSSPIWEKYLLLSHPDTHIFSEGNLLHLFK